MCRDDQQLRLTATTVSSANMYSVQWRDQCHRSAARTHVYVGKRNRLVLRKIKSTCRVRICKHPSYPTDEAQAFDRGHRASPSPPICFLRIRLCIDRNRDSQSVRSSRPHGTHQARRVPSWAPRVQPHSQRTERCTRVRDAGARTAMEQTSSPPSFPSTVHRISRLSLLRIPHW